jgi:hypothetical protein
MKKSNFLFKSLFLSAFFVFLIMAGCKKDNNLNGTTNYPASKSTVASESGEAEAMSDDILNIADQVLNGINVSTSKSTKDGKKHWYCAEVSVIPLTNDNGVYNKIIIDFGTDSVACYNGKYRSGQIIITFQGHYFWPNFTDTITFNNFKYGRRQIDGTHIVTNILSSANDVKWNVDANIIISRPDGKTHEWQAHRVRELTTDTINNGTKWDTFIYKIYDQAGKITTGKTFRDTTYTITITNPIIKHLSCYYIEAGRMDIKVGSKPDLFFDWGTDGTCDNLATVTINGKTYKVVL